MYLLEFLFKKFLRFGIPLLFWLAAILIPVLLAQLGALDYFLIAGRCYHPLGHCGQDNVSLAALGIGVLSAIPAVGATFISICWDEHDWVQQREKLKEKYRVKPPVEPVHPNIYSD
jgi:hypothetical protein